ncbi:interferon regulatory factor 4-like [Pelobates cultripes]|uniref:Interferon regulatory factor 4-like n=2 Tax=Pelobates cultripes TaxID=61616 RepID=A0AAD1WFQ9_PELCU|nr:interferon regulatory factor 4-like [Pelobates cultripes]CAH2303027.1 interferon regulatory factor 4-like [Pelobates cultripes]
MSHTGTQQLRLKEWLVLQINSGRYPGLRWENEDRTLFRIPWKHASKQDYKAQQDAALFKAWAIYKGKYREGSEKDDPSVWKTRLRCALNKSPDFQEVQENSQMELPEPYKLYRIVSETRERSENVCTEIHESSQKENLEIPPTQDSIQTGEQRSASPIKVQNPYKIQRINETLHNAPGKDRPSTVPFLWATHPMDHKAIDISDQDIATLSSSTSDYWLHIRLYYQGKLVTEVTTQTAEGCRIVPWPQTARDFSLFPAVSLEEIHLPSLRQLPGFLDPNVGRVLERLLLHLDNGVLMWVAPEGVFVKRQCQARVYWSGPLAPHIDRPNKLEREKTWKVLDMKRFMHELYMYVAHDGPEPQYQIQLCFGEEYPDVQNPNSKKLITAHVEPVFAREQLLNIQKKISKSS